MRCLVVFAFLAAILYTASAFSFPPAFPVYGRLPDCAGTCRPLVDAVDNCSPPRAPVTNNATYLNCFCQSEELRSLHDIGELCRSQCNPDSAQFIHSSYEVLCGSLHHPATQSPTPSPTLSKALTSSLHATSTTSTQVAEPTNTSTTIPEELQGSPTPSRTWAQKNWMYIVAAVVVLVTVLALVASALLYCRRRHLQRQHESQRPLSDEEDLERRIAPMLPLLQEALDEEFGPIARGRIIPLRTMNPDRSLRGRLSRLPIRDPIVNRRQRRRDVSTSTIRPLTRPSHPNAQGIWAPKRPGSVRTTHTVSSFGQRSVSSPLAPISPSSTPLSPISPAMLRKSSLGESLRAYKQEQVRQQQNLEEASKSFPNLRRAAGLPDGQ